MSIGYFRLLCPLLFCTLGLVTASESLQQRSDVRLWQDLPSDVLIELNNRLHHDQRFAWYADPVLDVSLYPGHSVELLDKPLTAVLDAYCAQTGLAWQQGERVLWIYQPAEADYLAELQVQLHSDHATQRIAARNALLSNPSPDSLRIALLALGDDHPQIAQEALRGLHDFLHSSPEWGASMKMAMTLFGDPDWPQNAIHPFLRYHMDLIAPWAALQIAAQDEAVAAAITKAIERHQDTLDQHLVLGMAAVCARLPEPATQAMTPWFEVGGGWQQRYIGGSIKAALRYAGALELPGFAELTNRVSVALEQLASDDRRERKDAKRMLDSALSALAERADGQARDFILDLALVDEHPQQVRASALDALQQLPHEKLLEPLIKLHQSQEAGSELIRPILDVIRQIPAPQALDYGAPAILAAVQGQLANLTEIKDASNIERRRRDIHGWLEDIAKRRGPLPIAVFAPLVGSTETPQELRREICRLLRDFRHPTMVEPLVAVYHNDEWPDVRRAAALALGHSRLPAAITALREALHDRRSPAARKAAVEGLAQARDSESFATLMAMIKRSESEEERIFLIQHAGVIRHPDSADFLIKVLNDTDRPVWDRQAAASALSLVPTTQSRNALVEIIKGQHDINLQRQTMDALAPRSYGDVPLFTPILIELLASRPQGELLRMVVSNLRRCMVGLSPGSPLKERIEEDVLELVADGDADNNARRQGLELFAYSDQPARVADRLQAIRKNEKNPIMRRFIERAIAELRE